MNDRFVQFTKGACVSVRTEDRKYNVDFSSSIYTRILVDVETGVNYIFFANGQACGMTPLLDAKGKPVVWTDKEIQEAYQREKV